MEVNQIGHKTKFRPKNIMIDDIQGTIKICNFDFGKRDFPEELETKISRDIYSQAMWILQIGLCIYQLVTYNKEHKANKEKAMLEPLRVPVTLDDNFKNLLKRMLDVDPTRRIKAQ